MSYTRAKEIYSELISQIKSEGLYKTETQICSAQGAEIKVRTSVGPDAEKERTVLNFCANNYLGLSSHPEIIKAAHRGIDERGYGLSSVRFICGTQDIHKQLEQKLSSFLGMEDSILFSSCFDANAALFEGILTAEDAILSDRLVHASLIDGVRLCKAQRRVYEHCNMQDLEEKLKATQSARLRLIITDGVFSMDGDMAPLDQIVALAEKYKALVAVDDSHATGFIGKTGRGVHEHYKVMDKVDIITTTFGKALGGASGGAISARKEIVEVLRQKGRPYLFSNTIPPAVVAGTLKALELLSTSTDRRDKLEALTHSWRGKLSSAGFKLKPGNTPIVPVMLGDAKLAQNFGQALLEEGIYAVGFFYPVVPKGEARIRTQMSAALEPHHLEKGINAFTKIGKKLGVI